MATDDRTAARPAKPLPKEGIRSGVHSTRTPQTTKIATGNLVDGRYLVGEIIGTGAFGLVFEAKNVELDEKVALKTMRPEIAVDTAMVARFAREAKAAAAIKSEYVATVYDVGTGSDGLPYIVMEYLDGKNLSEVVERDGPFAPQAAVEYALQICEALAVAHSKGIVHRDIKPENLLLTERAGGMRIVKVLDFGISKAALSGSIFGDQLPIVKTVNLMGTPLYMSPEQVRCSDAVDLRSDIWQLGMVLYEIIAGRTAFEGTSITEICAAILEQKPSPLENHARNLPSGLVDVIMHCLEKDAKNRYQNIAEVALALMPFAPKRSRLNVERAVSVLQSAGHVDADVKVVSAMPPVSVESLQAEAMLRESLSGMANALPGTTTVSSPAGTPAPASARDIAPISSLPVSGPSAAPTTAAKLLPSDPPMAAPARSRAPIYIAVAIGVIGLGVGAASMLRHAPRAEAPKSMTDNAAATTATATTTTVSTPTVAVATATATPTASAAVAPGAGAVVTTSADATPDASKAAAGAKANAKPVAPAPWPPANLPRGRGAVTAPPPPAAAAAPGGSATTPATPAPAPRPDPATAPPATPADTATGRTFRHQL